MSMTSEQLEQLRMNALLATVTFDQADKALDLEKEKDDIEAKEKFYAEDHLQDGKAYMGPQPVNTEGQLLVDELKRNHVSKNMIGEIVDRENNAVAGHQPNWTVTVRRPLKKVPKQIPVRIPNPDPNMAGMMIDDPSGATMDDPTGAMVDEPFTPDEQKRVDEMNTMLIPWWDRAEALEKLQTGLRKKQLHGRGYVRLFVPPAKIDANGKVKVPPGDFQKASELIFAETPELADARIVTDPLSMERVGYTRFMVNEDPVIEAVGLTEDGKTVIKTIAKDPGKVKLNSTTSTPLSLGGRLTLFEIKGKKLVTKQIISQQKLLNLAMTMCGHNLTEAGFRTETLINAELEETEVSDLTAPGGKRKVPASLPRSVGSSRNIMGYQYYDRDGKMQIATPGYHVTEPVPVDTFIKSKDLANRTILEEAHQLHALLSGDGAPSGESRIVALADFVIHCLNSKNAIDSTGQWMLESVAAMAAQFAGQPDYFADLRIHFNSKIDPGRLTPEERNALMSEVDRGLKSRKTYMLMTGEPDPEAETSQIFIEERQRQQLKPQVAPPPNPGAVEE